jgi:hypothetical protein
LGENSHAAFANDQPSEGNNAVRDAGLEAMRDPPRDGWSEVDEASDPPANY